MSTPVQQPILFDTETYSDDAEAWIAFKHLISTGNYDIANYYNVLYYLRHNLLKEIEETNASELAKKLNLPTTGMSYIQRILRVIGD